MRKRYLPAHWLSILLLCFAASPVSADLITIDFEADVIGSYANGFTPSGVGGVEFSDSNGENLSIGDFGTQGSGSKSLAVGDELDGSLLQISLGFDANFLSLDFGNDDPLFTNQGDLAVLTVFLNLVEVGQAIVEMNRDDAMNQTISFGNVGSLLLFDFATFAYTDPNFGLFTGGGVSGTSIGLTEVVDNIQINSVSPTSVPEPGTAILLLTGIALLLGFPGSIRGYFRRQTDFPN